MGGLLCVFIYSSAALFMIVDGQSTTDDSQDDVSIVEQIATLRAEVNNLKAKQTTLRAEVEMLRATQSSVTVENRKLFSIKLCFAVCTGT